MNWILEILIRTRRMRGLSEMQLRDLIKFVDDIDSLKAIKAHLESGSFKYKHLEARAGELIQLCKDRAKEIKWNENVEEIYKQFIESLGDLL